VIEFSGKFIKIFDTLTASCLHSLKRGIKSCVITNACFSANNDCLAVSSNTNTIHLYPFEKLSTENSVILKDKELITSVFKGFSSYLPDMLVLPTSTMKLHLADKLECPWIAKEGSLLGPIAVFNMKHTLVFLILML